MPDRGAGLDDALSVRIDGTTEGMTLQVLAQIRDSLAAVSRDVRAASAATTDVRERVIRLEERDKRLNEIEGTVKELSGKVDALFTDKDRRDGATGLISWVFKNWPGLLGMLALALVVLKSNGKL